MEEKSDRKRRKASDTTKIGDELMSLIIDSDLFSFISFDIQNEEKKEDLQKRNIFHNFLSPPPKNDID
jgi:hypothetical protein